MFAPGLVEKRSKNWLNERVGTGLVQCNRVRKRRATGFDASGAGWGGVLCYFGAFWCIFVLLCMVLGRGTAVFALVCQKNFRMDFFLDRGINMNHYMRK
jgi:hypothetical protein